MPLIVLTIEYDGSAFSGWQYQPRERTVQGVLEKAVGRLLQSETRIPVAAASRTDAGVHARAQVVTFEIPASLPMTAWTMGLNTLLPADLAVLHAAEVPMDFDPRRSRGKRYVYKIWNAKDRSPLRRNTHWMLRRPLDPEAMRSAAPAFLGEHDFASFRARGCAARTTVRRLTRVDIQGRSGGEIVFEVEGNAFLRHMVRNIVGTLVEVGLGRMAPSAIPEVLAARQRIAAGRTAPAQGLTLEAVYYVDDVRD